MVESLCCSPKTTTALLISSAPIQNKKFFTKYKLIRRSNVYIVSWATFSCVESLLHAIGYTSVAPTLPAAEDSRVRVAPIYSPSVGWTCTSAMFSLLSFSPTRMKIIVCVLLYICLVGSFQVPLERLISCVYNKPLPLICPAQSLSVFSRLSFFPMRFHVFWSTASSASVLFKICSSSFKQKRI